MNSARTLTDQVVSVVDKQTGGPQPDSVSMDIIKTVLCANGREDPTDVEDAVAAAVRTGRLVEIGDRYKTA